MSDTTFIMLFCTLTIILDIVLYAETQRAKRMYDVARKEYIRMKKYVEDSVKLLEKIEANVNEFIKGEADEESD